MSKRNSLFAALLALSFLPGCSAASIPRTLDAIETGAVALDVGVDNLSGVCVEYMGSEVARCERVADDAEALDCIKPARQRAEACKAFVDEVVRLQTAVAESVDRLREVWPDVEPVLQDAGVVK